MMERPDLEYLLSNSAIITPNITRQGSATSYQITLVKNIISTHRIGGVLSQYDLFGARAVATAAGKTSLSAVEAQMTGEHGVCQSYVSTKLLSSMQYRLAI